MNTTGHASDLRLGERWTFAQRSKNDALWFLASLALLLCRPLPHAALRWLGRGLGLAALTLAPGARRTAVANVARVFPALGEVERRALVRRCFATLGECLGETVAMLTPTPPVPLAIDPGALDAFREALAGGRGVLFASAHLGPWERVAASLAAAGIPIVVLARESYDPRFTRLYARVRERHGVEVLWRGQPGAAARILRALRGNRVLGVPMDLSSRVASSVSPFLGHDAPTAVGPARIALRTGARVVVGSAAPSVGCGPRPGEARDVPPGSLVVTATQIDTSDLEKTPGHARVLTRRINEELSRRILALPHAWVWMHNRWERA
jgi:KDO2-lipid IV(A) lauroyltransferase